MTEDEGSRQQSADERRADRIAAALSDGPQTRAELADLLGVGPAAVSKAAAWEREHERRFASDGCTHVAAHYSLTDA